MNDTKISVTVHHGSHQSTEIEIHSNMTVKQLKNHIKSSNIIGISGNETFTFKLSVGKKVYKDAVLATGHILEDDWKVSDLELDDGDHLIVKEDVEPDYASGESEYDNARIEFNSLKQSELQEHLKELWRLCYLKSLGASQIKKVFYKLHQRVINYGTTKNINTHKADSELKILKEKSSYILLPDDNIKKYWNVLMVFLLAYVALWLPINVCFQKFQTKGEKFTNITIIDYCVDGLFVIDIFLNFISAYDDPITGLPVINMKSIAQNYLTGWFIIDFISVFPFQLIELAFKSKESSSDSLKLARLARLPRLYKIVRVLRMVKILRVFRKSTQIREWINSLNIEVGLIRMLKVLCIQIFMVHIMACIWFLFASLEDNLYETWVGSRDIVDSSMGHQYFESVYWAFQTVTTVGYGDFSISTPNEYILALLWMIVGVNFYSFTIGNVSSIIASMDSKAALLNSKLNTLNEYSKKYNLPMTTQTKIKSFFEN